MLNINFDSDLEMMNKTMALCIVLLFCLNTKAQDRNRFAFKFYSGPSFTTAKLYDDDAIKLKKVNSYSLEFSYNNLLKKKHLFETGFKLYSFGSAHFLNKSDSSSRTVSRFGAWGIPFNFHYKIGKDNRLIYLYSGVILIYNPYNIIFRYTSWEYEEISETPVGLKPLLNLGARYIFKSKKRKLGLEINYIKGFNNMMTINTFQKQKKLSNQFVHRGTGIHLGLVFLFGGERKEQTHYNPEY